MSNHFVRAALYEGELIGLRISPKNQIAKVNHRKPAASKCCDKLTPCES
jgi:hypothetical protein